MKALIISTFFSLSLLGASASVKKILQPIAQIHERSAYVGGWPLALPASESAGCPAYAPVECGDKTIPLECCPTGQTAFVTSETQYCCPDEHDCYKAALAFQVCANSTWLMYQDGEEIPFCCEPGQQATTQANYGLCEPADVAVPSNKLAPSLSQDTLPATAAASSLSVVTSTAPPSTSTALVTAKNSTTTATVGTAGTVSAVTTVASSTVSLQELPSTTSAVGSALTTATGSGSESPLGTAAASVSAHTGSSIGVSMKPATVGSVLALFFGMGVSALMG